MKRCQGTAEVLRTLLRCYSEFTRMWHFQSGTELLSGYYVDAPGVLQELH